MVRLIYTVIAGSFLVYVTSIIQALTVPAVGTVLALTVLMGGAYIAVKIDERRRASR